MFKETIVDQNPHWSGDMYIEGVPRKILNKVIDYLGLPHIISIVGVRRAGKSTLIKQAINFLIQTKEIPPKNILFLNLETPQFSRYRTDVTYLERVYEDYLKLASPEGTVFCFLDEVQFFTEWQVFVKSHYEEKKIKFIVTGSNSRLLSSEFITLLSGRTLPLEVFPFSFGEFLTAKGLTVTDEVSLLKKRHRVRHLMDEYLHFGGFPEPSFVSEQATKKEILVMYARNIIYRDIAPRFTVKKPLELENLFFYLMSNISSLYTYNKLSKLMEISDKTIKDYLSYFTDAYLLFTIDLFNFSVKRQIKSPKKVYAIDTGMARASSFSFSEDTGHYLENLVFIELKRKGREIYYYKTANDLEVDFACKEENRLTGLIQVSKEMQTDKVRKREIRALIKAMDETGLSQATIVTYEDEEIIRAEGKTINVIPAYKYFGEESLS